MKVAANKTSTMETGSKSRRATPCLPDVIQIGSVPQPAGTDQVQLKAYCTCGGGCPRCNDGTHIQAKQTDACVARAGPGLESRINKMKGRGQPLSKSVGNYFESRFGYDFGQVRVHTDYEAGQTAKELNAFAFTVGENIIFGYGQFSPDSDKGKRLLGHELVHVIQQSRGVARIQRFVSCSPDCPPRSIGEVGRAGRASLEVLPLPPPDVGVYIRGFDIDSHDVSALAATPGFSTFWGGLVTGSDSYEILGFTDCQGSEGRNTNLRLMRAMHVNNTLPPTARTHITRFAAAPLSDCISSNNSEQGRLENRSVAIRRVIRRIAYPDDRLTVPACPPTRTGGTIDPNEYVSYILCAEATTRYSPRNMLAMLRQLYYGKPWSVTSTTNRWDNVIPCSPDLGDPSSRLGTNLYHALRNSVVVGGADVGHVFTGLEAMICPMTSVPFFLGLAPVGVPNEEFATFTGDLGAAVAANLGCNELGAAAANEDNCGRRAAPQGLGFYFNEHAPREDIEGDIDPFVIRTTELGFPCTGSLGRSVILTRPISAIFHEYYTAPSSALGAARPNRYRCVLNALGANISAGNQITNRAAIAPPLETRVYQFSLAFYHAIRGIFSMPGQRGSLQMRADAHRVVDWFLTYLQRGL